MSRAAGTELIGLEIADDEVRLAVAVPEEDGYAVQCRRRPLPEGAVRSGYVVHPDAVADALRGLLAGLTLRSARVSLALGGRRTICRVEPLADPNDPGARAASADRMRRYLVFGGQPASVSHTVEERPGAQGAAWLLGAATLRDLVARQVEAAKRGGLTIHRAEPAMAAVVRLRLATEEGQRPAFILMARPDGAEVGAVRGDGLIYCQHLGTSAQALAQDGAALLATLEQVADYHLRHAGGAEPIEDMLCCGGGPSLEALFGRLADGGIHPRWLDPAELPGVARLEGDGVAAPAERAALAPAVAAALSLAPGAGAPGSLDLLPPPARRRRLTLVTPAMAVPVVLTLVAVVALLAWDWAVRRDTARLTHLLNHPTAAMLECSRLQRRESQLKQRRADAELLLASARRRAGPAFVAELPRRLLKEVWLERLSITQGSACVVEGMAHGEDAVFGLAEALRRSPHVEGVRIGGTGSERVGALILTRFRLDVALAEEPRPDEEDAP